MPYWTVADLPNHVARVAQWDRRFLFGTRVGARDKSEGGQGEEDELFHLYLSSFLSNLRQ